MSRQALRCTANGNGDGVSGTETEDVCAGRFGNGGDTVEEKEVPVEGEFEVGFYVMDSHSALGSRQESNGPSVRRCGMMPGNRSEKLVPSVANVAKAPLSRVSAA